MEMGNKFTVDGVDYPAAVEMLFEREVPRMNGTRISADNVTACMSVIFLSISYRICQFNIDFRYIVMSDLYY